MAKEGAANALASYQNGNPSPIRNIVVELVESKSAASHNHSSSAMHSSSSTKLETNIQPSAGFTPVVPNRVVHAPVAHIPIGQPQLIQAPAATVSQASSGNTSNLTSIISEAISTTEKTSSSISHTSNGTTLSSANTSGGASTSVLDTPPNHNLKYIMAEAIGHDQKHDADVRAGTVRNIPLEVVANKNNNTTYNNNAATASAAAAAATHDDLVSKLGEIVGEDRQYGLVKLTVHYDELRSRLSVTVHEARYVFYLMQLFHSMFLFV